MFLCIQERESLLSDKGLVSKVFLIRRKKMSYIQQLESNKLIAIMRGVDPDDAISIFHSLKKGGIKAFEITLDSPKAYEIIEKLSIETGDDVLIGAGTVLAPESARTAIYHGANCIISPRSEEHTSELQ